VIRTGSVRGAPKFSFAIGSLADSSVNGNGILTLWRHLNFDPLLLD
jgi:hypothetical protein